MEKVTLNTIDSFAQKFIDALPLRSGATVLALQGDLGAGKTTLTQAIGRALGIEEKIPSPTFLVMRSYQAAHPRFKRLVHIDAYRLEDPRELEILHFDELLQDKDTLIAIEWPERIGKIPEGAVRIKLEDEGEGVRRIEVHFA